MPANARGDTEQQAPGQDHAGPRIVAGADGSPSSMSALRWAVRQAGLTGAAVDAVIAWSYPGSAVDIRSLVVEGIPAQVLLDASDGADLLVVSSRGHVVIRGKEHD
jgi:nucleotide-binding universal stress UspA family protein